MVAVVWAPVSGSVSVAVELTCRVKSSPLSGVGRMDKPPPARLVRSASVNDPSALEPVMVALNPSAERVTVRPLSVPAVKNRARRDGGDLDRRDNLGAVDVRVGRGDVQGHRRVLKGLLGRHAQVRRVGDGVHRHVQLGGAGSGRGLGAGVGIGVRGRRAHLQGEVIAAVGGRQDGETAGRKARQVGVGERPVGVGAGDGGSSSRRWKG